MALTFTRSDGCECSVSKSGSCETMMLVLTPFLANRIKLLYTDQSKHGLCPNKQTQRKDILLYCQVQKRIAVFIVHSHPFSCYSSAICLHRNKGHWQQTDQLIKIFYNTKSTPFGGYPQSKLLCQVIY